MAELRKRKEVQTLTHRKKWQTYYSEVLKKFRYATPSVNVLIVLS
jgi:hypothetical protein